MDQYNPGGILVKNNIKKLYLYSFFHSLIFAYVIERLFWASKGITIIQVVWIELIYAAIIVVLELPMGMYADRFSRKNLIVLDAFFSILEILIISFAQNFWHFAIAVAFSAVGFTLQSGAHNALVYDTLAQQGETASFEKVLGRIEGFDNLAAMVSGLIGGIIAAEFDYVSTYRVSLISLVIAFFIALSLREVRFAPTENKKWVLDDWMEVLNFVVHHKRVRKVMFAAVVVSAAVNFLFEFWQLYAEKVSVAVIYFGVIQMVSFMVISLGGFCISYVKDTLGFRNAIIFSLFAMAIGFAALSFDYRMIGLGMMAVIYFASAIVEPVSLGYMHQHAIDKYRATIESAFSVIEHLAVAVIGIPFGLIATEISIFAGFAFLSGVLALLTLWSIVFFPKTKEQ